MNRNCLTIMLEHTHESELVLRDILDSGYNGTIIAADSLKHTFLHDEKAKVPAFLSLIHLDNLEQSKNIMVVMILTNEELSKVKSIVHDETESFTKIKGCMYTTALLDYEGSF